MYTDSVKNFKVRLYWTPDNQKPICFRQTFKSSGKYGNIQFVYDEDDADFYVIGNWSKNIEALKGKKIIFTQQEPPTVKFPEKKILDICCLAISPFNIDHSIKQFIAPTVLQWTHDIDAVYKQQVGHVYSMANNRNLEDLIIEEPPVKNRLCSMIVSAKSFTEGHKKRLDFTKLLMDHFKNKIDFYGFGIKEIKNKKDAINPYLYSISIENSSFNNYFTEKISDVFLGFSMPIYYGCPNINEYFPEKSLIQINIEDKDDFITKIENCINQPELIKPKILFDARRRVLTEYNLFRIISVAINTNFQN